MKNKQITKKENNKNNIVLVIVGILLFLVFIYIVIYLCFLGDGFLYSGKDLEKRDWLSFLGMFLSFVGTIVVCLYTTIQNLTFTQKEKRQAEEMHIKELQPVFSVSITGVDSQIEGTAEAFNITESTFCMSHKNVSISIENIGKYPIRNVIIFDKYMYQLLKTNERQSIYVVYSDSPDLKYKTKIIEVFESKYERSEKGIPKWFNINYEDIDGNEMYQTFKLNVFDGIDYYSLERIQKV